MKLFSRRRFWVIISGLLGVIALILILFPTPYSRYYAQFDKSKLIGLTKKQVLDRVGKPTGIDEPDDTWFYQIGHNPGAVVSFTDGKVTEVDSPLDR